MTATPPRIPGRVVAPGDVWALGMPLPLGPSAQLLFSPYTNELALIARNTGEEVQELFQSGTAEFGLVTVPGALLLAVDVTHPGIGCLRTEAVFQVRDQERGSDLPATLPEGPGYLLLTMMLVDCASGRIVSIRVITLDPAMTEAVRAALADQREHPGVPQEQITAALDLIYDRYGDAAQIIRQRATAVCRSERVAPGTCPGPVGQD
jgi:hypothetical protein